MANKNNKFMLLTQVLKNNCVALEKEEFKLVLSVINGELELTNQKLTPLAERVLEVFEEDDLETSEFYLINVNGNFMVAQNRSMLLGALLSLGWGQPAHISRAKFATLISNN